MAKKHMEKCSPSLAIKEMQIKTTIRFYVKSHHQKHHHQQVLARMWGKRNPRTLLVGKQASATTSGKKFEGFLKI
jgi:hypothetical protein